MNDLINDIEKLQDVKKHLDNTSILTNPRAIDEKIQMALLAVNKMITEKNKQVIDFEKTAPMHIQELCETLKGGK
tara:strand:+ start:308 stop:532 length:225 start_codon:yes stop_codon:yes gene_type:complete